MLIVMLVTRAPIMQQVKAALEDLQSKQTVFSAAGYVFVTKKGQPIHKHLDKIWTTTLKKAKLRHRPSYQLRHTFVTQCMLKGSTCHIFYCHADRALNH